MAETILKHGGQQIGDNCTTFVLAVLRATQPEVQQGVLRKSALVDDQSPNILYELRCTVHMRIASGGPFAVAKWTALIGSLMAKGKQTVSITGTAGSLKMEDAVLVGPVVAPNAANLAAGVVSDMPIVFQSEKKPT